MRRLIQNRSGFTLIELMVVVIIIAALAGMVLPQLIPASDEAKRNIAKGDIANISTALRLYRLHNDRYPTTEEGLDVLTKPSNSKTWRESYLEKKALDPWKRPYKYACPGKTSRSFDIWSDGPLPEDPADDVNSWDL
jgi:general secretion pathway protein G